MSFLNITPSVAELGGGKFKSSNTYLLEATSNPTFVFTLGATITLEASGQWRYVSPGGTVVYTSAASSSSWTGDSYAGFKK